MRSARQALSPAPIAQASAREQRSDPVDNFSALALLHRKLIERDRLTREAERRAREAAERVAHEARAFHREVADAVPLQPDGRIEPARRTPPIVALQRRRDDKAVLVESLSDEIDIERYLDTGEALSWRRTGIGPDVVRRLRRGEWAVRIQLDLHGLRVEEARDALVAFLARAMRDEIRCVRVIHGKGLGSVNREPILKRKVPMWLAQRDEVLAFCEARPNDGGSGAMIVLLRLTTNRTPSRSAEVRAR